MMNVKDANVYQRVGAERVQNRENCNSCCHGCCRKVELSVIYNFIHLVLLDIRNPIWQIFRGLDVDDVKFVINYDYPNNSEDYIHRYCK